MSVARDASRRFSYAGGTVDITPSTPLSLAGYEGRTQVSQSVSDPLEANAVVLGTGGTRVLFVCADLLFFGPELLVAVLQRAGRFGIPGEQVVLAASHTHFAPATDRAKPLLGEVDARYVQYLEERLVALVDSVLSAEPIEASLDASRVETDLNVNRRRAWRWPTLTRQGLTLGQSVVMAPAFHEPRDGAVDVLRVVDRQGKVAAVLWKYACHPVCFPGNLTVSSEYPGHARAKLRQELRRNVPVVFWQGFAGDVRPRLIGTRTLRDRLVALRRGPSFGEVAPAAWYRWADSLADVLISAATRGKAAQLSDPVSLALVDIPMSRLIDVSQNPHLHDRSLRIQRVAFGGGIEVLFVAAEVCTPYLRTLAGDPGTICVGYTGDVFGYLPSETQAREGGYEGQGFFRSFGLRGSMRTGFEGVVTEAATRLRDLAPRWNQARSSSIG